MSEKFDLFIFGSTSEFVQQLIADHRPWFEENVETLYVTQRSAEYPAVYAPFDPVSIELDCADPRPYRAAIDDIVQRYATRDRPMHVLPTFGRFDWNYAEKNPVFSFTDDGLQINLNARLQLIDAFRPYAANTRFHLFGSLFSCFPYTGDYALSMWYVNQLPRNADYADLDLIVYNLGGMKTRFWKYAEGPANNPFLHDELPTKAFFEAGFVRRARGVVNIYPSAAARVACFLGRRGVRVL